MAWFSRWKSADACRLLPTLDAVQTTRYRRFRRLLDHNRTALTLQADLEQVYYDNLPFTFQMVARKGSQLLVEVDGMVQALAGMTGADYQPMVAVLEGIEQSVEAEWTGPQRLTETTLVLPLDRVDRDELDLAGAKAANLGHVRNRLGLRTPDGFAVTTVACRRFLDETGLRERIDTLLADLEDDDPQRLAAVSEEILARVTAAAVPEEIRRALAEAAATLGAGQLAVRSSAIGEDGDISFAGQYTSLLGVEPDELATAWQRVIASLYSTPALSYRMHHGLDDRDTPMAVLVLAMIEPQASGVLYTADPTTGEADSLRISSVRGLGDQLVGGKASPERMYRVAKDTLAPETLAGPGSPAPAPPPFLAELARHGLRLEADAGRPLDIEWAVDSSGAPVILQMRPLLILPEDKQQEGEAATDYPDHPLLLEGGRCAAGGVAAGRVRLFDGADPAAIDADTILVARAASTALTPWASRVRGLITDIGGTASHLASVAREFGVPALFDTRTATTTLNEGDEITLWASRERVFRGRVEPLLAQAHRFKRPIFHTPAHARLQRLLDEISPLHLTDPDAAEFAPDHCRTVHDIIRYCHEMSVRQMFNLGETIGRTENAVRLQVNVPLVIYALDMGGGLRDGLTTCDTVSAHDVTSVPFVALWRGFSYPGINWSSAIGLGGADFLSLMAAGARPQQNTRLGGASYAILAGDYLNLSVRFGYHFATVDALCGDEVEHNYLTLNFAGGAGAYHGRSLRIQFLAEVLDRLGFDTAIKGDLLEASLGRLDRPALEPVLDQVGRLLAASRLLDMALKTPGQVQQLTELFFQGRYDFLDPEEPDAPAHFHQVTGDWTAGGADGEAGILQDGSRFVSSLSVGLTRTLTRLLGQRYQDFLDNIEAYQYFPLLIARESRLAEGTARVRVKLLGGDIDRAGGLAFALRDWANYFVLRIDALDGQVTLLEFRNGKPVVRRQAGAPVRTGAWHSLQVDLRNGRISGWFDGTEVCTWKAERTLDGYLGLWTKADSVTLFQDLTIQPPDRPACLLG